MTFLPPFIGTYSSYTPTPMLPPVPGSPGSPGTDYSNAPYMEGPFCFGLDKLICQGLGKVHIGGAPSSIMSMMGIGTDLDLRDSCRRLSNALCAVLILFILLTILAIAINRLME